MNSSTTIFLDFDETLLSNVDAHNWIVESLTQYGITEDMWTQTYALVKKESGVYDMYRHYELLNERANKQLNAVEHYKEYVSSTSWFLFPDSVAFLEKYKENTIIILSYGEQEFQRGRIKHSGIEEYTQDVIVTSGRKSDAIKDVVYRDAIFIDDKIEHLDDMKKYHPDIETILIDRDNKNTKSDHRTISNLYEL